MQARSSNASVGAALFACNCSAVTLARQWWLEDVYSAANISSYSTNFAAGNLTGNATTSSNSTTAVVSPAPLLALAGAIYTNDTAAK